MPQAWMAHLFMGRISGSRQAVAHVLSRDASGDEACRVVERATDFVDCGAGSVLPAHTVNLSPV